MIGILGGTFDPIHYGHLRLAEEVREALNLEQVRFIPAFQPPHRAAPSAPPEHRLAMVKRALADHQGFVVDTREYARGGTSWMVDTCTSLREEFPERPLVLIMGMDAFNGFTRWRDWQGILDRVHLAIATRPGVRAENEAAKLLAERVCKASALECAPSGRIVEIPITALDISATHLRQLSAQGRSSRYLLPEPVRTYILEHQLYQTHQN